MSHDPSRIERLFDHVLKLESSARDAYLEGLPSKDRIEILTLLRHHTEQDPTQVRNSEKLLRQLEERYAKERRPLPERIESFSIKSILGEGGMGIVYHAVQDSPRRDVALKIPNCQTTPENRLDRFDHEVSCLAHLQHPGIAQIYDAGTTTSEDGPRPFFVMELVDGLDLLAYSKENELSTKERIELFVDICEAVHHAHQREIVHRDLKPSNILVTKTGQPKILDFGVAKSLRQGFHDSSPQTLTGQALGTPTYMSPEQVSGDPKNTDTRSDQYALGVVLFQLLTGRLPYHIPSPYEAAPIIREEAPTSLRRLRPDLDRDLEAILNKTLEKDPGNRYQSTAALRDDLLRFLSQEPIQAAPRRTWSALKKFVTRHKVASAVAGVSAIVLLGVTGLAIHFAIDAIEERARLRKLQHFETLLFERPARGVHPRGIAAETLLASNVDTALEVLRGDPYLLGEAHMRLGRLFSGLGDYHQAVHHLQYSLNMGLEGGQFEPERVVVFTTNLMVNLSKIGEHGVAAGIGQRILATYGQELDRDNSNILDLKGNLIGSWIESGELVRAESLLNKLRRDLVRQKGEDAALDRTGFGFGMLRFRRGEFEDAERIFRSVLSTVESAYEPRDDKILVLNRGLGGALFNQDKFEEVIERLSPYLREVETQTGEEILNIARLQALVGESYYCLGEHARAATYFESSLPTLKRFGRETRALFILGRVLVKLERSDEAVELLQAPVQGALSRGTLDYASTEMVVALALANASKGNAQEAKRLHRRAMESFEDLLGVAHNRTIQSKLTFARDNAKSSPEYSLELFNDILNISPKNGDAILVRARQESLKGRAECLWRLSRWSAALEAHQEALESARKNFSSDDWFVENAEVNLAAFLSGTTKDLRKELEDPNISMQSRIEKSLQLAELLEAQGEWRLSVSVLEDVENRDLNGEASDVDIARLWIPMGRAHLRLGNQDRALELLQCSHEVLIDELGEDHQWTQMAKDALDSASLARGTQ